MTVTSVGLGMPGEFTVTGSPVTTSGTLTATKNNQSANTVYSGPFERRRRRADVPSARAG